MSEENNRNIENQKPEDKQANSLEHQLNNCRNTAEWFWLKIK